MSKGITIRTVLLILIGIIVIGVVAYFVYSTYMDVGLDEMKCRGALVRWCSNCRVLEDDGWTQVVGYMPKKEVTDCAWEYYGEIMDSTDICRGKKNFCMNFIPIV